MRNEFYPGPADLMKSPEGLRDQAKRRAEDELRQVLPQDVSERLDDYSKSVKAELIETFGSPEIPEELSAEMQAVLEAAAKKVGEDGFSEEIDEVLSERLRKLAVRAENFKDNPAGISVRAVPEEGYLISYKTSDGRAVERPMSVGEQDMLFTMEMWADQFNQSKNAAQFSKSLRKATEANARFEDPEKRRQAVRKEMYRRYEKFGFGREQIDDLIALADDQELPEMAPDGKTPGMRKVEIMLDTWRDYLSKGEKTQYAKLAAGIIGIGAAEGAVPALLQKMMDSQTMEVAGLFAAGYFGASAGLGWVKKKLTVDFDGFINDVTEKEGGLNERLSKDLVFQPGEKMAAGEDRGRLMTAMRRGQAAFRETLSGMAKATAPAIASAATGVGIMMANDWRLGLVSLASAPIAVAIARRAQRKIEPVIRESYRTEDKTAQEVEEQISAHMEIVLSGMRDSMGPRLESLMRRSNELTQERATARAGMDFQMGAALNPAVIAGLTVAGVAMRGLGVQESGKILTALVYSGMFRTSFDTVVRQQSHMLESCASIIEMEEVFNGYADEEASADKKRVSAAELPDFSIELKDVTLRVGDKTLIEKVNATIPAGSVVRIEGMSGHGKTTLTKLMAGYYRPSEGSVRVGGQNADDVRRTGAGSIYGHIAYLSQHPYVFDSGNLRDNLRFGNPGASDEDMSRVIDELGLGDRFSAAKGIDLDGKVTGLSGGEKTRLGLARVLLKMRAQENGGVVFLDEPTEGLDEETEAEVASILVREKQRHPKLSFVVVSHRRSFIEELAKERDGKPGLEVQRIKMARGKVKE